MMYSSKLELRVMQDVCGMIKPCCHPQAPHLVFKQVINKNRQLEIALQL